MKNLFKALLKAQQAMGAATKDAKNPFFKSKYADYGAVLEAVKGPFNDNGIVVLQPLVYQDGKSFVKTVLAHAESGEVYESFTEVVCTKANDPQSNGSAITYARRYGLQSLPCLPTEDDDGNTAAGKHFESAPVRETTVATSITTSSVDRSKFRRVGALPPTTSAELTKLTAKAQEDTY
jgi:hypothetical protein